MKLKRKRLILISLISTFGVGMLMLTIGRLSPYQIRSTDTTTTLQREPDASDETNSATQISTAITDAAITDAATTDASSTGAATIVASPNDTATNDVSPNGASQALTNSLSSAATITDTPTPVPTVLSVTSPTPVPLKVYPFEAKDNPKLNALFQDYYLAKLACDTEKMKELLICSHYRSIPDTVHWLNVSDNIAEIN
jgi:hypothetical protein